MPDPTKKLVSVSSLIDTSDDSGEVDVMSLIDGGKKKVVAQVVRMDYRSPHLN